MFSELFIIAGLKIFGRILIVIGLLCFLLGATLSIGLLLNQTVNVYEVGLGLSLGVIFYGFFISFMGFIGCGLALLLENKRPEIDVA